MAVELNTVVERRRESIVLKPGKSISKEDYKEIQKQREEARKVYNTVLFLTRQRYFSRNGINNNVEHLAEYHIQDWDVYKKADGTYGQVSMSNGVKLTTLYTQIKPYLPEKVELNSKLIQQLCRKVGDDWRSYFALNKTYAKGGLQSTAGKPKLPRYKKTYTNLYYPKDAIPKRSLRNGIFKPTGLKEGIKLSKNITEFNIQSARIIQKNEQLILELIYNKTIQQIPKPEEERRVGIDVGVDVLMALAFDYNKRPLLYKSKELLGYNQLYNKKVAEYRRQLPKGQKSSRRIKNLTNKRNNQVTHYIHVLTNRVAEMLKEERVTKVVVGWNKGLKEGSIMGKKSNQKFVGLPIRHMVSVLEYKLRERGIEVEVKEESYTSKASVISEDYIPEYKKGDGSKYKFSGYRKNRGLYKDVITGKTIQADINGAYNILRKHESQSIWGIRENIRVGNMEGIGVEIKADSPRAGIL